MVISGKKILAFLSCFFLLIPAFGCSPKSTTENKLFAEIVWPLPPNQPRIKLTGILYSPEDIGIERNFFETIWDKIKGENPIRIVSPMCSETDTAGRIYIVDTALKNVHVFDQQGMEHHLFNTFKADIITPIDIAVDNAN